MESGTGDPVWHSDFPIRRIAVIAALELEARILRSCGSEPSPLIYISGPGRERARESARRAIAEGARALVAFGLAGGLSSEAVNGAVVLPESLMSPDGEWSADAAWRRRIAEVLGGQCRIVVGPLYSADHVVAKPEDKAALAASSGAAAVDMESAAVARAAAEAGIPFIALRAVADGPDDELPPNVESLVTGDGRTSYRSVVAFLGSPRRLELLFQLAGKSRVARRQLGHVMKILMSHTQ